MFACLKSILRFLRIFRNFCQCLTHFGQATGAPDASEVASIIAKNACFAILTIVRRFFDENLKVILILYMTDIND